jgi:hypothetical protein
MLMARRRLFPGLVALTTFAALTIAVLAPCLCAGGSAGPAGKPPSCHAAMARQAHSSSGAPSFPTWMGAPGCCCAKNPAPTAATPATASAPAEPERSILLTVSTPAALWAPSAAARTESLGEPPKLEHAPPPTLLPLRI